MRTYLFLSVLLVGSIYAIQPDYISKDRKDEPFYEIELLYDSLGIPENYKAYINTPICEADKCYWVQIEFYWDLIGRFQQFDTIPGEGLTKLDHIPFTQADYEKLDRLLQNPDSPIGSYEKEDLVKDTRDSEIDGFTGATIREIKEIVIEGGVYSCYTLWHIAHGTIVDSLQQQTTQVFDQPLIEKLVGLKDQAVNYYLLNHFSTQDFSDYLPQFLNTLENSQGYYVKNALEKMPAEVVSDSLTQLFFARKFEAFNYFAQVALLKKLQPDKLTNTLKETLEKALDERSSSRNDSIIKLLDSANNY